MKLELLFEKDYLFLIDRNQKGRKGYNYTHRVENGIILYPKDYGDNTLEYTFGRKIIAYLPLKKGVEEYDIPLLPKFEIKKDRTEKRFTIEDMMRAYKAGGNDGAMFESMCGDHDNQDVLKEAFENAEDDERDFENSLYYPKMFNPILNEKGEIMVNISEDSKKEIVGIYEY